MSELHIGRDAGLVLLVALVLLLVLLVGTAHG